MTTGTLRLPRLGETMEEGRIVAWLVAPGDHFERGDPLIEVETDKTVVEYPALGSGTLAETLVSAGDSVPVGAVIATIDVGEGPDWTAEEAGEAAPAPAPPVAPPAAEGTVTVDLPMPPESPEQLIDVVVGAIGPKTRVVSFSGIMSPTGWIMSILGAVVLLFAYSTFAAKKAV